MSHVERGRRRVVTGAGASLHQIAQVGPGGAPSRFVGGAGGVVVVVGGGGIAIRGRVGIIPSVVRATMRVVVVGRRLAVVLAERTGRGGGGELVAVDGGLRETCDAMRCDAMRWDAMG